MSMVGAVSVIAILVLGVYCVYSSVRARRDIAWRRRQTRVLEATGFFARPGFAAAALAWMWLLGSGLVIQSVSGLVWAVLRAVDPAPSYRLPAQIAGPGLVLGSVLILAWAAVSFARSRVHDR